MLDIFSNALELLVRATSSLCYLDQELSSRRCFLLLLMRVFPDLVFAVAVELVDYSHFHFVGAVGGVNLLSCLFLLHQP